MNEPTRILFSCSMFYGNAGTGGPRDSDTLTVVTDPVPPKHRRHKGGHRAGRGGALRRKAIRR